LPYYFLIPYTLTIPEAMFPLSKLILNPFTTTFLSDGNKAPPIVAVTGVGVPS